MNGRGEQPQRKQSPWGKMGQKKPLNYDSTGILQEALLNPFWLVVEPTHLKNISQIGNLPQLGMKIKDIWNHHLALSSRWFFFNIPSQVIQYSIRDQTSSRILGDHDFQAFKFVSRGLTIPKKDASQKEAGSSSNHPFSGATFLVMQTPTSLSYSIRTKAFRVWSNHTILSKFCQVFFKFRMVVYLTYIYHKNQLSV